jgi:tetratricopeptide (TPR) repeat protein
VPLPVLLLLAALAPAQERDLQELLDDAEEKLIKGSYAAAEKGYQDALKAGPKSADALLGLARVYEETGRYEEAGERLAEALRLKEDFPPARRLLARVLYRRGRWEESRGAVDALAQAGDLPARALRAAALHAAGRHADAEADDRFIERAASQRVIKDPAELTALGQAYHRLGRYRDASEVFNEAADRDPEHFEALIRLGALYLDAYDDEHMDRPILEILRLNPTQPEANLLRARARLFRSQSGDALEALGEALRANPNLEEALVVRATLALEDQDYPKAAEVLETAIRSNPSSKPARAVRAGLHLLTRRPDAARADLEAVLKEDAVWGEAWRIVGDILADQRRYEEARDLLRKAVELDRRNWKAWNSLGRTLFNLGEDEEGTKALKTARDGERLLYKWRENMLALAGRFSEFITRDHGRFRIKLHVEDHPILRTALEQLLEDAWSTYTRKYGFRPDGPIVIEVFPAQEDFAVRTVGFEGIVGVLGACFGKLVTMNSPKAFQREGGFHWPSTAWHEVAHVFTLQLSRGRVPRWLTEGISVYEETVKDPAWGREMELELLSAWRNGTVLPVRELNGAFRDSRIGFAYYQSGLLVDHVVGRFGFAKLPEMLKAYGEDLTTVEVFRKVLGVSPEEVDASFLQAVEERVGGIRAQPAWNRASIERFKEALARDPKDVEAATNLARAWFQRGNTVDAESALARALEASPQHGPALLLRGEMLLQRQKREAAEKLFEEAFARGVEDFHVRMRLAALAAQDGKADVAEAQLRRADAAFPRASGEGCPVLELAALLRKKEDEEGALKLEEHYTRTRGLEAPVLRRLATAALEAGAHERALEFLDRLAGLTPYEVELHHDRARALRTLKRPAEAAEALRVAVEVDLLKKGEREAALRAERAAVLLEAGDREGARREAEAALKKDAGNAEAREVLERIR